MDTALGKGLALLEALARADGSVRLSHLADQVGLQKSSVHRVLRMLIESGYVTQDPDTGYYAASLKVFELGAAVVASLPIKVAATNILQQLHLETGETVSLSVLDGDHVVYLDKLVSPRPIGFTTRVGSRVPAAVTAAGRAMLAHVEDPRSAIERLSAAREAAGIEPLDADAALADIEHARTHGYLIGRGRRERGIVGIAAAVPGPADGLLAGLTVSAPAQRLDDQRQESIVQALLVAVAQLGQALGRG